MPVIRRIVRISGEGAPSQWDVETDRGPTRFTLDSEDDVRRLGAHRVMITDARKLRVPGPRHPRARRTTAAACSSGSSEVRTHAHPAPGRVKMHSAT